MQVEDLRPHAEPEAMSFSKLGLLACFTVAGSRDPAGGQEAAKVWMKTDATFARAVCAFATGTTGRQFAGSERVRLVRSKLVLLPPGASE